MDMERLVSIILKEKVVSDNNEYYSSTARRKRATEYNAITKKQLSTEYVPLYRSHSLPYNYKNSQ